MTTWESSAFTVDLQAKESGTWKIKFLTSFMLGDGWERRIKLSQRITNDEDISSNFDYLFTIKSDSIKFSSEKLKYLRIRLILKKIVFLWGA
jgi:hypothetical protein